MIVQRVSKGKGHQVADWFLKVTHGLFNARWLSKILPNYLSMRVFIIILTKNTSCRGKTCPLTGLDRQPHNIDPGVRLQGVTIGSSACDEADDSSMSNSQQKVISTKRFPWRHRVDCTELCTKGNGQAIWHNETERLFRITISQSFGLEI